MEGGKGGNSYWPGFVDALTNVVIAMIFVVVVLAISLSFAAQMMGKKVAEDILAKSAAATASTVAESAAVPESLRPGRTRIAVAAPTDQPSLEGGTLRPARNVLQLDFAVDAVTLDDSATKALKGALAGSPQGGKVAIVATGPSMQLTANQRAAYLRVLAVRNVLIQQGYSADKLDLRIDTKAESAGPVVNISFVGGA